MGIVLNNTIVLYKLIKIFALSDLPSYRSQLVIVDEPLDNSVFRIFLFNHFLSNPLQLVVQVFPNSNLIYYDVVTF